MSTRGWLPAIVLLTVTSLGWCGGILEVRGCPGLEIYLDGELTGYTPMTVARIPAGVHEVGVRSPQTGEEAAVVVEFPAGVTVRRILDVGDDLSLIESPTVAPSVVYVPSAPVYVPVVRTVGPYGRGHSPFRGVYRSLVRGGLFGRGGGHGPGAFRSGGTAHGIVRSAPVTRGAGSSGRSFLSQLSSRASSFNAAGHRATASAVPSGGVRVAGLASRRPARRR